MLCDVRHVDSDWARPQRRLRSVSLLFVGLFEIEQEINSWVKAGLLHRGISPTVRKGSSKVTRGTFPDRPTPAGLPGCGEPGVGASALVCELTDSLISLLWRLLPAKGFRLHESLSRYS